MKKILIACCLILLIAIPAFFYFAEQKENLITPLAKKITEKPLEKYSFENLRKTKFKESKIEIGKLIKDEPNFSSYVFYYRVNDPPGSGKNKRVSGLINIPAKSGTYPILVMFRGYVDREKYTIGEGTRHSGEVFANPPAGGGFITLAPDFLGYGESDPPSLNSLEERFQTYTTALALLESVKNLNDSLKNASCKEMGNEKWENGLKDVGSENKKSKISHFLLQLLTSNFSFQNSAFAEESKESGCLKNQITADTDRIGVWGHSNGGHIALSVLAVSGKPYPTVLWAPVSKPFPYSVLYFTDEFDDHGKALRKAIANFEKDYDAEKFSPANYYNWINAPIQLHQGTEDQAVPLRWTDQFNKELVALEKDVSYYTYIGDDHNFAKGSWPRVIQRSIDFYRENLK